jgi:hypothetical protein
MGKASGVLLVVAGLSLTAYVAQPTSKPPVSINTDDFDFRLSQPTRSKAEPIAERASPRAPLSSATASLPYAPAASSGADQGGSSAPAVVTVSPHNRPNLRLAVAQPPKAGALATDRTQLARELQKELRRVGCYDGEIHGAWTTSSKRAMKAFTERMNASLPVEEPDQVLLSLLHGQPDKACGRPCPAGESAAEGGRCVPSAVASSPRKLPQTTPGASRDATTPAIGLSATTPTPSSSQPLEGRMGLSGPDDEDPRAAGLGGPPVVAPAAALPRPSAGYGAPIAEGRNAAPVGGQSRRFDSQSFFRRLDKQSAN